jgi:hypothetical protein
MKPPKVLDRIADVVLAYKPKPKTKPARKRARRRKKIQGASCFNSDGTPTAEFKAHLKSKR